jgi:hypothetical protein
MEVLDLVMTQSHLADVAARSWLVASYASLGIHVAFDFMPERALGKLRISVGKGSSAHVTFWGDHVLLDGSALSEATRECVRSWVVILARELRKASAPTKLPCELEVQ